MKVEKVIEMNAFEENLGWLKYYNTVAYIQLSKALKKKLCKHGCT